MSKKLGIVMERPIALRAVRFLFSGIMILIALFSLAVIPARAAPVAPDVVPLIQPDGSVIIAVPFGDESYSGYEYDGYTILQDNKTAYWVYAVQTKAGGLVPGERKVGIDTPAFNLPQHLRDKLILQARPAPVTPAAPAAWGGSLGAQKILVILTDFTPSTSRGTSDAAWNQLFFDNAGGAKSIRSYYEQASYNQYTLSPVSENYGVADDGVISVVLNYAHPNTYPSDDNNRAIARNAMIAADPYVNYAALDTNGNGALDVSEVHLMVIVRGFEKSYGGLAGSCSPSVWGHRGSLPLTGTVVAPQLDGVYVGATTYGGGYTEEGEWHEYLSDGCDNSYPGHMSTIGIMVHELGHDMNWPDLYDTDDSSMGVGTWSVMANGSWGRASGSEFSGQTPTFPDVFLRVYQKWLTPIPVTSPQMGVAVPTSATNPVAYLVGVNPGGVDWAYRANSGTGEYFLIENRQQVGFDTGLWRIDGAGNAKGCLIWHIDETRTYLTAPNNTESRKLVDLEEAHGGVQNLDFTSGSGGNNGDAGDPWPGSSGKTAFGAGSDPNSNWYDLSTSGIAITNISTNGTGCTVDFSGVGPAWTGNVSSQWDNVGNWSTARTPNQADNVVIPGGTPNSPDINAASAVGNLVILNNAHLNATANALLTVAGDWIEMGTGFMDATAGTVAFTGSFPQTVSTGPDSHFFHLQIGNGSTSQTVTASSDLHVNGNLTTQTDAQLALGSRTLRLGGNWISTRLGFAPGNSTVILDGAAQSLAQDFTGKTVFNSDVSSGWTAFDANADGARWGYSTSTSAPNSPDHGYHARYFRSTTVAANDWMFSTGFSLQAGMSYSIRFNYGGYNASKPEKMALYIGTAANVGAMTNQVFDDSNITNLVWKQGSGIFTPASTGTYYLGFYAYSPANQGYPGFDDVVVTEMEPDIPFYNLSVTAGSTTALSDNVNVLNNLVLENGGALGLGSYNLSVEGSVANNGSLAQTRTVNGAATNFLNIKNRAGSVDKYFGATIDPGGSNMGSTTVTVRGNQRCPYSNLGVLRCFDLAPTTVQAAAVTLYYTEGERNGVAKNLTQVYHWDSSLAKWDIQAGTTTFGGTGDGQWVRVTGVSAYSPFALNSSSPTNATFTQMDGLNMADGSVTINWQTISEQNLVGFVLYRSDSETGVPVRINDSMIPGLWAGSQTGGSYSYRDTSVEPGKTYYYWIEITPLTGAPERYGPLKIVALQLKYMFFPVMVRGR